jgi:hypothetical protein
MVDNQQVATLGNHEFKVVEGVGRAVKVRCGSAAGFTDYSATYSQGTFTMAFSGNAGQEKYMLDSAYGSCTQNSSAGQGTISTPMASGAMIEIHFNENYGRAFCGMQAAARTMKM